MGGTKVGTEFFAFFERLVGASRFARLWKTAPFLTLTCHWKEFKTIFVGSEASQGDWWGNLSIGDALLELTSAATS
eukprot:evm.model.scf_1125.3 EVM.evm.TU.scf_1125.3   scf_1125:12251-12777(-)